MLIVKQGSALQWNTNRQNPHVIEVLSKYAKYDILTSEKINSGEKETNLARW